MFVEKLRAIRAQSAANRKTPIYRSTVPRIRGNQYIIIATTFAAVILGALNISALRADSVSDTSGQSFSVAQAAPAGQGNRAGRPPREALEACANVEPQSACSFNNREGDTVQGKCMSPKADVPLACAPANAPKNG
ncbi:hypothetical protein Z945_3453 [Sulfitobacter noctilucae]|uniref:hypothetical protein n=1 Tax=Sulfitobacter noctilucae TaxID=1342302 RepID=UPI00046A7057|nr:hypothetical protein [Sulfitobacter noctilucae]KIN70988.1 hypothetical protein Z945_3453 [Sulfitobacter noctilucae]